MPGSPGRTVPRKSVGWLKRLTRWAGLAAILCGLNASLVWMPAGAEDLRETNCRYGLVSMGDPSPYAIDQMGVSAYLDGGSAGWAGSIPGRLEYIPVLSLKDWPALLDSLQAQVESHKGATWLIGDEPDNRGRDNLLAEEYAARYYQVATRIRERDPDARLGFGAITQPSPIRVRYLQRAWEHLMVLAGGRQSASDLVDIWNIHAFYLDEVPGTVDAGIPPGFDGGTDAYGSVSDNEKINVLLFENRLQLFRGWMQNLGEQRKPLWISSFGVWMSHNQINDNFVANFMSSIIGYLQINTNTVIGYPADNYHLVQRWFWYSLNGSRSTHFGSLYDPIQIPSEGPTLVGDRFITSTGLTPVTDDLLVDGIDAKPLTYHNAHGLAEAQVTVRIANAGSRVNGQVALVSLFDEVNHQIDQAQLSSPVIGCGDTAAVKFIWKDIQLGKMHSLIAQADLALDPLVDPNLENNRMQLDLSLNSVLYFPLTLFNSG